MNKQTRKSFKLNQTTVAVMLATATMGASQLAQAGLGYGWTEFIGTGPGAVEAFFAHSPAGPRQLLDPDLNNHLMAPNGVIDKLYPNTTDARRTSSGKALRKFIDPLPLPGVVSAMADGSTRTLPVAVAEKWVTPEGVATNDDYYEIAVVEYTTKMHSDLPKPTTLRGYVQLVTNSMAAKGVVGVALTYPDGSAIMIQDTNADGTLKFAADGVTQVMKQAMGVQKPDYLGPVVIATRNVPTRFKFHNLLPVGRAVVGAAINDGSLYPKAEVTNRRGDLYLPVDPSLMGAGWGPDGMTMYSQNRATVHLHGGDTPWISDGTPHQWIAPAGEGDATLAGSLASEMVANGLDPYLPQFLRGASAVNVPDMPDPGAGAMTFYFPNAQSSRLMFYHDHSAGITRLNVYAGEAAAYLLTDDVEQALVKGGSVTRNGVSTTLNAVLPPADRTIPLVLQDKTFVPDDIALQDARWNTTAWGKPGDLWFPHVYETVQDPSQLTGFNAVGRWHYGPWFWPVFPALYGLPTGEYNEVTTTPEAWQDTAVVNGVAYPTLTVDPTAYRLRILNAANDRIMTFNLFVADPTVITDDNRTHTEVKMQSAALPDANNGLTACLPGVSRPQPDVAATSGYCTPETWPSDNRNGGVPSADSAGPTLYQIASEGGLLPKLASIEPTPVNFQYDKGRITVLNVLTPALYLGPAERADVVVDFSAYAGKTLLVYNDAPAPVPAGDPRNDYFTGVGDQSPAGGAEDTRPGYGPNTRTMMQIKVNATAQKKVAGDFVMDAAHIAALTTELPKAYALAQERPVVGQSVYNDAFGEAWADTVSSTTMAGAFANIYVGSLKQPVFNFQSGDPGLWQSIKVTNSGSGYITAPEVVFTPSNGGTGASAKATLKINDIAVTNPGAGYTVAPVVSIIAASGGGAGATATASLGVVATTIANGGSGYNPATPPLVTFSMPQDLAIGVRAQGTAIVNAAGVVTGVTITEPGRGYATLPTMSIAAPSATAPVSARARATAVAGVKHIKLVAPDPSNPVTYDKTTGLVTTIGSAGGGGYSNMAGVTVTLTGNGAGATATASGQVFDVTMISFGEGYMGLPNVSLIGGGGAGAAVAVDTLAGSALVKTKAVHELFDATYGRLNSIGAVEIPFTSALTQTTIPLAYIDPPTEMFENGETQIWKFTHNGVDTHPVHFHLLNVQVINRVGWDGWIDPPAPNEVGWKETVKMNPLEDIIVAVRAKRPPLPGFGLPHSVRLLDPTQPEGSPFGFTQVDANSGNPAVVTNVLTDFKWEYVWHCHILGHEENDFMRPVVFNAREPVPSAPAAVTVTELASGGNKLAWTDTAATEYRFDILRASAGSTSFVKVGQALANATTFTDKTATAGSAYAYQVVAVGQNGSAASAVVNLGSTAGAAPAAPSNVTIERTTVSNATVSWLDNSNNETGFQVQASTNNGATWSTVNSTVADATSRTVPVSNSTNAIYRVAAVNAVGSTVSTNTASLNNTVAPATPSALTASNLTQTSMTLTWTDVANNNSNYTLQRSTNANFSRASSSTFGGNVATRNLTGLNADTKYYFRLRATNSRGSSAWSPTLIVQTLP